MTQRDRIIFILFGFTLSVFLPFCVNAQDTKEEFVPNRTQDDTQTKSKRKIDLGPAGPRLNSTDLLRREKESRMQRQERSVEKKLTRLIKNTPDDNPRKPQYLDRLASFYWKLAGETQNNAYLAEERCFEKSKKTDDDITRCDQKRKDIEKEAEKSRMKAIQVYEYIVKSFPNFNAIDRILFALAFNYQQKLQNENAKVIYTELIQNYNTSPVIPDALFNMADIYFGSGDINSAADYYNYVIKHFEKSSVYIYAIYKLGWCYYNQNNFKGALNQFIQVIKYQNKLSKRQLKKNRLSLKKEAQRDLVRVYVNIDDATATGGIKLLKRYAPNRYDELAERLADLYTGTGQFNKSTQVLRRLIADTPKSYRVVGYQRRISENISNTHRPKEAILSLKRLVTLWNKVKTADDATPKRVKEDHIGIERQLNSMARHYHNLAIETKSRKDYNTALELYETYVQSFPNEKTAYEMNFYYAELLYKLERWQEAANIYEKVLSINGQGNFTKDSAHGALLSYKKLLKNDIDSASTEQLGKNKDQLSKTKKKKKKKRGKRGKRGKKGKKKEKKAEPFKPKEIPQDYKGYLKASKLYRTYVQESEYLIDIQYEEARVYYVFNHLDKAIPLFKKIAERYPTHQVASYAAELLLECYNRKGDIDSLGGQVNIFIPIYKASTHPKFNANLQVIKSELDFRRCSMHDTREEHIIAAKCFLKYTKRFPKSKIVDKAYFNAALNYDREKQIEKAIQTRVALLNNVEDSDLKPKVLYQIAQNLQALAIYSSASKAYEEFAKVYPRREETTEALRRAAQFRLGLGELDQATTNLKNYIKRLSKKDQKQAMVAYFELGEVLKERKQWGPMIKHYRSFTKRFKRVDAGYVIRAYTLLGNAYVNLPSKYRNHKKAKEAYQSAIKAYKPISKTDVKDIPYETMTAVAESMFKLANYDFQEVRKIPFMKVKKTRDAKKHIGQLKKNITKLIKELNRVKSNFEKILPLNVSDWGLAALTQIGEMYNFTASNLENAPAPSIFDEETKEFFRNKTIEQSAPFRQLAIQSYQECLKQSLKIQWFNKWSDLAEKQVAKLDPSRFRYNIEERGKPTHFHNNRIQRQLVLTLPEDEVDE